MSIYAHKYIDLPENYLWWKNRKVALDFHVNHLLALQLCVPKLNPYISKELLQKISTNSRNFCIHWFSQTSINLLFPNISFCKSDKSIYFACINFRKPSKDVYQPRILWNSRKLLWCRNMPSSNLNVVTLDYWLQKPFWNSTREFRRYNVTKQRPLASCLLTEEARWLFAKIKSRLKVIIVTIISIYHRRKIWMVTRTRKPTECLPIPVCRFSSLETNPLKS